MVGFFLKKRSVWLGLVAFRVCGADRSRNLCLWTHSCGVSVSGLESWLRLRCVLSRVLTRLCVWMPLRQGRDREEGSELQAHLGIPVGLGGGGSWEE